MRFGCDSDCIVFASLVDVGEVADCWARQMLRVELQEWQAMYVCSISVI